MTPIVCQGCGAHVGPGANFCPTCGAALGPAQRSTGQLRLVESIVEECAAKLDDASPYALRAEGRELSALVARWADLGPLERRLGLDRLMSWSRAVRELRTK